MEETKIGDFSRPLAPPPSGAPMPKKIPDHPNDKLTQTTNELGEEIKNIETTLKPLQTFEDALKEVGVTKHEAAKIVDDILLQGYYTEVYNLTSRIKVKFRTREYRDTMRLQQALEVQRPVFDQTYNEVVYKYTLAGSLEQMASTSLPMPDKTTSKEDYDRMFDERLKFIEGLSDAAVRMLYAKFSKFEKKINVCTKEGTVENF